MLKTANALAGYSLAAGEAFILSVQLRDDGNAVLDHTTRKLILSFYGADRAVIELIEGVLASDATGSFFRFVRDGRFSDGLYGQTVQVELAEQLLDGREILASGPLIIERSSGSIASYGSLIGRTETRAMVYFDAANIIKSWELSRLRYTAAAVVVPPVTLGGLTLSGTLRAGTASNGTISGATAGSTITENVAGFTVNSNDRTWQYDGSGSAGTIANGLVETHPNATNSGRQSAVTVASALTTLAALTLAAATVTENATPGTVVGGVLGKSSGSTLSLANDDGGRFAISGTNLVAGLTNIDYEAATSRNIVLRETLAGATNSPRDTPLAIGVVNVNEQPSLRALLLSSASFTVGTAASGAIAEAATGSAIALANPFAGFTINGGARTWAYDGSGPAGNSTITLTETLGDSPNSPRATPIGVTVAAAGPAPFIVTSRQGWDYEDGFDGTPEMLKDRPNWSPTTDARWKVRDSAAYQSQTYGPTVYASYGPDLSDNYEVEFDYDRRGSFDTPFEASRGGMQMMVRADDGTGVGAGTDGFTQQIGNNLKWDVTTSGTVPRVDKMGSAKFRVQGGYAYSAFEGVWNVTRTAYFGGPTRTGKTDGVGQISELNLGADAHGRVGMFNSTWTYPYLQAIRVRQLKCHIIEHDRFVGPTVVGGTTAEVKISGWYTGTASRWGYRLLAMDQTTEVQAFRELASVVAANNAWTGLMTMPIGGPYVAEVGYLDAAGVFNGDISRRFSAGDIWVNHGQSNARGRAEIYNGTVVFTNAAATNSPLTLANGFGHTVHFGNKSGEYGRPTESWPGAVYATDAMGRPVCILSAGQDATGAKDLVPGTSGWTKLEAVVNPIRGVLKGVIYDGNENDSDSTGFSTTAQYVSIIRDQMIPGSRTLLRNPNPIFLFAAPGRYATTGAPNGGISWDATDTQRDAIKQAVVQLAADASLNIKISSSKLGVVHKDPYHYEGGPTGVGRNVLRDAYSMVKWSGASVPDGRDPIVTSVARSGAVLTCDIDANGATGFTGFVTVATGPISTAGKANTFKGYQVSVDNFATLLPVNSIAVVNGKLVITLASAPSGPVKLRSFYGASFDDTELIYGTYGAGRENLPIFPIWAPLTSN